MALYKEYVKTETEGKEIKLAISFNKDSYNHRTGQPKVKGYYVTVVPVKINRSGNIVMEEYVAFTGFNKALLPVDRQSAKRLETAKQLLETQKEELIKILKEKYNG